MTLGLDISDGAARAVIVNAQARVMARGEQAIGPGAATLAVRAAVGRVLGDISAAVTRVAVAMPHPGDAAQADVDAVLRELLPDAPPPETVAAGVAVVVAEQWCGAAKGLSEVVALSAGEHVTSGIILEGKPWMGAHGMAGSVSWLSVNPVEREDYRRLGCLEAEVSSSGIERRMVWRIKSGDMLLESIRVECGRRLRQSQAERPRIVLSAFGGDAAAIGAARLASLPA